MMWTRGAPADWDGLAARGNPGWSWADVLPAYRAIEDHSLGASETRGAGGPLGISVTDTRDEVTAAILAVGGDVRLAARQGRQRRGHRADRLHPVDDQGAAAAPRPTTRSSARYSPARPRRHDHARHGLTVATRTRADRLTFDGRRVTGVKTIDAKGAVTEVGARREVILCAGAVETPLLLERSGIGRPRAAPQARHRPGRRVTERRRARHRAARRRPAGDAQGTPSAAASRLGTPAGRAREALKWLATGEGLLSTGGYDLVCQFKSGPAAPRPDVQGLFVPMALDTASKDMKLARHPGILFMAYPIRPETTSSVHISGGAPQDPPVIDARFLETDGDRDAVAPVLEIARAVLAQAPVDALIQAEEFPGPSVATRQDTVEYSLAHRHRHLPRRRLGRDGPGRRRRGRRVAAGARRDRAADRRRLGPAGPGQRQHRRARDAGGLPRGRPGACRPA